MSTDLASSSTEVIKRAPIDHSSSDKTYGSATSTLFGHVKLSDAYSLATNESAAANDGIAASKKALSDAYNALNKAKAAVSHADTATTYGSGTSTKYGHVKLSDTYKTAVTNGAADNGVAASQKALYDAYTALATDTTSGIASKAPISHASEQTTYGVGTGSAYGHLKISDTYTGDDVATTGAAANGIAASLYAVNRAAAAAATNLEAALTEGHAKEHASSTKSSHVTLSDSYEKGDGAADAGVGASSNALADAYSSLLNSIATVQNSLGALNNQMAVESTHTEFASDGTITTTSDSYDKSTVTESTGDIVSTLEIKDVSSGEVTATMVETTTFNSDGSIDVTVNTTTE
jgi:hypothetical protein